MQETKTGRISQILKNIIKKAFALTTEILPFHKTINKHFWMLEIHLASASSPSSLLFLSVDLKVHFRGDKVAPIWQE